MKRAGCVEIARVHPGPCEWVVQLGAVKSAGARESTVAKAPGDQDLAVGQQRRSMKKAGCVEMAGVTPRPCGWIVQLRSHNAVMEVVASHDQDLAVRQQ